MLSQAFSSSNPLQQYQVSQSSDVKDGPLPYLLAFTVHGVAFTSDTHLEFFMEEQEDCRREVVHRRHRAALAIHDLKAVRFPLFYTLQRSDAVQVHVLNTPSTTTGSQFLMELYKVADAERKSRKMSKFKSLYRYLKFLNVDTDHVPLGFRGIMLPVVMDASQTVISIPPLTSSDQTRLTTSTTSLLVELTGDSIDLCESHADVLIDWLLKNACPTDIPSGAEFESPPNTDAPCSTQDGVFVPSRCLVVRPIRVVGCESPNLRSLFRSRLRPGHDRTEIEHY